MSYENHQALTGLTLGKSTDYRDTYDASLLQGVPRSLNRDPLGLHADALPFVGGDIWTLPCPRALDHTPPGDWTLAFQRNATGEICGVMVGCWLARRLLYRRTQ